jgi:prepilin peptidase CpaA
LTVPGLLLGIFMNAIGGGWPGAKHALFGAGLGLGLLLPFALVRSLGAGDWKLVGALGAFLGPSQLLSVLFAALLIAGLMALVLVIWKKRLGQTLHNISRMLGALFSFHLPGQDVSLDNPQSLKIPFGVAMSVAAIVFATAKMIKLPR